MLKHRNENSWPAHGFYTYAAFIAAANSFSSFGTMGDVIVQKREILAFLVQTSHKTTGPAGKAITDSQWTCSTTRTWSRWTQQSHSRPQSGSGCPQSPKPSCHDVITVDGPLLPSINQPISFQGTDTSSTAGSSAGAGPTAMSQNGSGSTRDIVIDILGVSCGDILDCCNQKPFD
uniref:chitinase n=1 Tax=Ananas comosus var. bracteatus TaxID=296719 RepID=A0A6V7NRV9_ANACO|nr:unnamed protein product [Ananas comosus var. bracteatus]